MGVAPGITDIEMLSSSVNCDMNTLHVRVSVLGSLGLQKELGRLVWEEVPGGCCREECRPAPTVANGTQLSKRLSHRDPPHLSVSLLAPGTWMAASLLFLTEIN